MDMTEILGKGIPILQAPMAGEPATPGFLRAALQAGVFGGLGAAYLEPETIASCDAALGGTDTDRLPYQINLFVPQPAPEERDRAGFERALRAEEAALGLAPAPPPNRAGPDFQAQLQAALASRAAVLSFTFGLPAEDVTRAAKAAGKQVWITVNTAAEAVEAERAGADAVLAQGFEAGGHRGGLARDPSRALVGTLALVPACADAVRVPVIAAGGIADGRGVAAVLVLGARAAAIGTAFLTAEESPLSPGYKDRIRDGAAEGTALTRAYSGRWARGIETEYMRRMAGMDVPDFPMTNTLTGPMRKAARAAGDLERQSLWAGQAGGLARREPLAAIAARIRAEAAALLAGRWAD